MRALEHVVPRYVVLPEVIPWVVPSRVVASAVRVRAIAAAVGQEQSDLLGAGETKGEKDFGRERRERREGEGRERGGRPISINYGPADGESFTCRVAIVKLKGML